jgi:hypothetical protein
VALWLQPPLALCGPTSSSCTNCMSFSLHFIQAPTSNCFFCWRKSFWYQPLGPALHKELRPSKVGAVSTKILALMAPSSASSDHFNKSITGANTLVCKGLGAKESRPLYKALKILAHLPLSSLSFALLVTLKMDEHRHKITVFVYLRLFPCLKLIYEPQQHGLMFGSSYPNHLDVSS